MVLVTRGTGGDVVPLLAIGSALLTRHHQVTVVTHSHYANMVEQAGLTFVALDNADSYRELIEDGPLTNTPRGLATFFHRHVLLPAPFEYELFRTLCSPPDTLLITRHMSSLGSLLAAEEYGTPVVRVLIAPSQIATMSALEFLCERFLANDINRLREKVGLPPVQDWRLWLRYPRRSIAPWPEWFASHDPAYLPGVVNVGFLLHDPSEEGDIPEDVKQILSGDEPPVLLTSGTGVFLGAAFYAAAAEGCRRFGVRGILVSPHERLVPHPLPHGVTWAPYLPFASVMPQVAAVIHHGGMCTLGRALSQGKPQLVLAAGADRPDAARCLEHLGVAEYLPPPYWQPDLVAQALDRLMTSMSVRRCCHDVATRLAQEHPCDAACQAIEDVLAT